MKTSQLKSNLVAALALMGAALPLATQAMGVSSDGTSEQGVRAFAENSLDGWTERSFDGNTHYELVSEDGVSVLKGHTMQAASILYREQTINLEKTPIINWSWKVDRTFMNIDEKAREGDDFPARLYVVAQTGFLPWETVAINYVWASEIPVGEIWTNPFTDKAKMVAIQSGESYVGTWTTHSRNVAQDFKALFDMDVEEINGYAVMVDGDNAKVEAIAWFGQINFSELQTAQSD